MRSHGRTQMCAGVWEGGVFVREICTYDLYAIFVRKFVCNLVLTDVCEGTQANERECTYTYAHLAVLAMVHAREWSLWEHTVHTLK